MPIRFPNADAIRREIATEAAALKGGAADRYLTLLGSVEPTWPPTADSSPWRLSGYLGAYDDGIAIERATAIVLRRSPLMRVR